MGTTLRGQIGPRVLRPVAREPQPEPGVAPTQHRPMVVKTVPVWALTVTPSPAGCATALVRNMLHFF